MTLKEACEKIRPLANGTQITFPRIYAVAPVRGTEYTPSALEMILVNNGVLRWASQEHGTRTYHVVHKRLEEMLEDGA